VRQGLNQQQNSRLWLLQEVFHGFNLLEVAGHVRRQHHLYDQGSEFSGEREREREGEKEREMTI